MRSYEFIREDASAGATGSASVAAAPAQNLFVKKKKAKVIRRIGKNSIGERQK